MNSCSISLLFLFRGKIAFIYNICDKEHSRLVIYDDGALRNMFFSFFVFNIIYRGNSCTQHYLISPSMHEALSEVFWIKQ